MKHVGELKDEISSTCSNMQSVTSLMRQQFVVTYRYTVSQETGGGGGGGK
jgi:hypothetical protein